MQTTETIKSTLGDMKTLMGQIEDEFKGVAQKAMDARGKVASSLQKAATTAKGSLEIPDQLKGAWDTVVGRIRSRLDFAPREEMEVLRKQLTNLRGRITRLERLLPPAKETKGTAKTRRSSTASSGRTRSTAKTRTRSRTGRTRA